MSVLACNRRQAKLQVYTSAVELGEIIISLAQRNFGIKDIDEIVRIKYAYGKETKEDFAKYRQLLHDFKKQLIWNSNLIPGYVRAANSIHPKSMPEYHQRRTRQNDAIAGCENLKMLLQKIVETFEVDVNYFREAILAIDREIDLIKSWRQSDNKIKSYLRG